MPKPHAHERTGQLRGHDNTHKLVGGRAGDTKIISKKKHYRRKSSYAPGLSNTLTTGQVPKARRGVR